ncbi:NrpR regulatory domain-containing protein [Halomarina pelagica]|uniref:NrpR regulatory domain-containing protein n=1 Tax=Halomarina pelagica TaxID=2961599 RepID=UPI0020C4C1A6|nr:NrpR regulatory domain-containing protein [Halomarina sp. BND7]
MTDNLDRRTYDLLRLIADYEPIGSIRLVDLLRRHGYSIEDRTVRLTLADLDEAGLTEKIPGRGRRLTPDGASELERGHVSGRLEQVRARIAMLTGQVTYDPVEDTGEVVASAADVPRTELDGALEALDVLDGTPLSPVPIAVEPDPIDAPSDDAVRLYAPSSITIDGVLLSRGINADLKTAGVAEYHPDPEPDAFPHDGDLDADHGGAILRYIDAINGEGSTVDVTRLLIEAGRDDVRPALTGGDERSLFVVDNREYPLTRYDEARDLAVEVRDHLGGVFDIRKPREAGPFPSERPGWEFASMTYGAIGELVLSLLVEGGYAESWETLSGLVPRSRFEPLGAVRARERA